MMTQPVAALLVLAALTLSARPVPAGAAPVLLAQSTTDGAGVTSPPPVAPEGTTGGAPGDAAASPGSTPAPATTSNAAPTPSAPAPASPISGLSPPPVTSTMRNGSNSLPTMAQPNSGIQGTTTTSVTFGGPQTSVEPVYGSTLRDSGAGNGGVPVYSSMSPSGGPINGTANAYTATMPNGSGLPAQGGSASREAPDGSSFYTQQPLGAAPNTRDQVGTFGGRAGYSAQGIYNGTASQPGNGYGSAYAPSGRPTGGLLSTNVDATGPLRPYIPLNNSPTGRPNSGYGVPNGSRPTYMDGRGIQRMN